MRLRHSTKNFDETGILKPIKKLILVDNMKFIWNIAWAKQSSWRGYVPRRLSLTRSDPGVYPGTQTSFIPFDRVRSWKDWLIAVGHCLVCIDAEHLLREAVSLPLVLATLRRPCLHLQLLLVVIRALCDNQCELVFCIYLLVFEYGNLVFGILLIADNARLCLELHKFLLLFWHFQVISIVFFCYCS